MVLGTWWGWVGGEDSLLLQEVPSLFSLRACYQVVSHGLVKAIALGFPKLEGPPQCSSPLNHVKQLIGWVPLLSTGSHMV